MSALFVTYSGLLGGAERLLLDALAGAGARGVLACPEGPLAVEARARGVPVLRLPTRPLEVRSTPIRAIGRLAAHAWATRALTRDVRPDAVVGWGARSILAVATVARGPLRVQAHNDLPTSEGMARALRWAARRADRVVTLSHTIAQRIGLDATVVHPGVDLDVFAPAPAPPAGPPTLVFLAALVPWKRPDLALEAVARLDGVRLLVAGAPLDGEGEAVRARLEARAARPDLEGRVELLGRTDARAALARGHALLHPAENEAFGIAIAEAMACGLPVALADAGAHREVADETCAVYFPRGDAGAAAAAARRALDRPELGAAGRARAEARFGTQRTRAAWGGLLPPARAAGDGDGVALVTVAHDSAPELDRFLASAARHLPRARVVVADSGSADGSAAVAEAAGAHVVPLGENVGFGRANNAALSHVDEPVAILANPDLELLDASLAALAAEAGRGAERILAPVLLRPDGRRENSAHPPPLGPAAIAYALLPPVVLPGPLRRRVEPFRATTPRRVAWAVGACLVARVTTLRRLGPFAEDLFLYGEDLDLGLRAARAGVETWFRPEARVVHHAGHASRRAWGAEPVERLVAARRDAVARTAGARGARADLAIQALTHANRRALKRLAGRPAERERAYVAAAREAARR